MSTPSHTTTNKNPIPSSVTDFIADVTKKLGKEHSNWAVNFQTSFANTLETTVKRQGKETFLLTGDIPAMWLRDSTAQVRPYLVLAKDDPDISDMIAGLISRQLHDILIDPYANAFNESGDGACWSHDDTDMGPWIWERKYEVDSLCYPLQLSWLLYCNTGRTDQFDDTYLQSLSRILDVWETERDHEKNSPYRFVRTGERSLDTLSRNGLGPQTAYTGMTWSGFRPSDDACTYSYLVPSNMFAAVELHHAYTILTSIITHNEHTQQAQQARILADRAQALEQSIRQGLHDYALTVNKDGQRVWAYEVDGLGHASVMDDANVPSLLSAPYLGFCDKADELYLTTRRTLLSDENPFYYHGRYAQGIGSSHTWDGWVWPIALSMQGLTSTSEEEKVRLLDTLVAIDAGSHLMHESVNVDNPQEFTRPWFSWSNMLFCELVMDVLGTHVITAPMA